MGSIPGQGTKIPHAMQPNKERKKERKCYPIGGSIGDFIRY